MIGALAGLAAAALPQPPQFTTIQVPAHVVITGTLRTDVDGDGRDDLAIACRDTTAGRREVRLHLRGDGERPFANAPSRPPYVLEADVVAFTYADATPAPGRELVLLTAERAVAVERDADGAAVYRPLFAPRLVWPAADPDFALPLAEARRDVDGDGRDDLLLPWPDGAVWWRAGGEPVGFDVPPRRSVLAGRRPGPRGGGGPATVAGNELTLSFPFGGERGDGGPLLRVRSAAPRCHVVDLDGDGRLDLWMLRNDRLFARLQQQDGTFAAREYELPLPEDRLSLFDPSFDLQLRDLDGDGRADLVVATSAQRDDAVEVRVDTFPALDGGGWQAKASGRLRVQTLARPPQLVDADGDGALDLVLATVRVDLLKSLIGDGPSSLEAQLLVFRNAGGRFAQPALLQQALRLPTDARGGNAATVQIAGGALIAFDERTLVRRPLARDGERLRLLAATHTFALPDGAIVEAQADRDAGDEVFVRTNHELFCLRWR